MPQFVGVVYQTQGYIFKYLNIKSHRNANKTRVIEKPFIWTDNKVLSRTKELLRKNGMSPKNVYDCTNKESSGMFKSHSQSKELRNAQQVYCQESNVPSATKEDSKDELLTLIRFQK